MIIDLDSIAAAKTAAIDDKGGNATYGQLVETGCQLAGCLPPRSVVFCLCGNDVPSLTGYIGLHDNGHVPLLLDAAMNGELLERLLERYRPPFLFLPEDRAAQLNLKKIWMYGGYVLGRTGDAPYEVNPSLSLLLTTSGSTGSPKLVRHKYGNLEANARNVAKAFGWTAEERPICSLPMNYTMGLNVINTHLHVGATLLLTSASLADKRFWNFITECRGTNFTGVPYSYDVLFKLKFMQMHLPHLTSLSVGGGRMTDKNFAALAEYAEKNGKRFFSSFGTTETSARMACLNPSLATRKCCSIGKAIPEGELYLLDDDDCEIRQTQASGALGYRGPNVTMGYAESVTDLLRGDDFKGEYKTGDLANRDAEGFYFITGRLQRFVKLYGLRVSLDECEQLVRRKFSIECACTGTDKTIRVYVTAAGREQDVRNYLCRAMQLPPLAVNTCCIAGIPRSPTGKTLYNTLPA